MKAIKVVLHPIVLTLLPPFRSRKQQLVQEAVPIRSLLLLLPMSEDGALHCVVLSLYNALFASAARDKKAAMARTVEELNIRNFILTKILTKNQSEGLQRQVFILQCFLFEEAANLMMIPVENQDPKALDKIKELRRLAFNPDMPKSVQRGRHGEDYKSLGFLSTRDPTQVFQLNFVKIRELRLNLLFYFRNHCTYRNA